MGDPQGHGKENEGLRPFFPQGKWGSVPVFPTLVEGKHGEIALVENLLRQDLTAVEEAEGLDRLMKEESYTQEQLRNKGLSPFSRPFGKWGSVPNFYPPRSVI